MSLIGLVKECPWAEYLTSLPKMVWVPFQVLPPHSTTRTRKNAHVFLHTLKLVDSRTNNVALFQAPTQLAVICSTCTLGVSGNEARPITYHGVASPRQLLVVKNSCLKHARISMIYKVSTTTLATSVSTL